MGTICDRCKGPVAELLHTVCEGIAASPWSPSEAAAKFREAARAAETMGLDYEAGTLRGLARVQEIIEKVEKRREREVMKGVGGRWGRAGR